MTSQGDEAPVLQLPGVYLISAVLGLEDVRAFAADRAFHYVSLDGDETLDKQSFLREVARALRFPAYFGENWDAFDESVRDLSWMPAKGYVLVYDGFDHLAQLDPAAWHTVLTFFHEATEYWGQRHIPMYVLLRGRASAAPGLPQLRVA